MRAKREEEERKRLEEALRARQEEERKRLEEEEVARQKQVRDQTPEWRSRRVGGRVLACAAQQFPFITSALSDFASTSGSAVNLRRKRYGGSESTKRPSAEKGRKRSD